MRSRSANLAGTQMACINIGEIDRTFRDALKRATRVTAAADRLQVSDATGTRLAVFAARVHGQPTMAGLIGTSWQPVKFQGGDGATLTPDERSTYTIEFDDGGRLTARIDCNRGRGTWKSSGPNQLQFGPLGLTRAKCPPGSMHDHIVKQCAFQHRVYLRRQAFERRLDVLVMVLGLTPARCLWIRCRRSNADSLRTDDGPMKRSSRWPICSHSMHPPHRSSSSCQKTRSHS